MRGRSLPLPGQYESPRPDNWRGAASPRLPSFSLCIHSISPVAASSATTARRVPAVEYTTPSTINGVPSKLNSGRGPSASVLNRHATSSLLKLSLVIWSSGEYRVLARSPPSVGHSAPFGFAGCCPRRATVVDRHAETRRTRGSLRIMRDMISRFAPAPTGFLHLGHVVNAVYVWGETRARGGRVLLRIEDHDRQRSRREYEAEILDDLAWLGFVADEPLVRQSERSDIYERALEGLRRRGLVYACNCSRAEIAKDVRPERADLHASTLDANANTRVGPPFQGGRVGPPER